MSKACALVLVLSCLLFSVAQDGAERFTGVLEPGKTLVTLDGTSITAREGALDGPKEIYIERDNSSELPIPLGEGLSAVTSFYRFGGPVRYRSQVNSGFFIDIPLSEGAPTGGLAVFVLAMPKDILDGGVDPSPTWFSSPATYATNTHQALTSLSLIHPEGLVFAVVEGRYKPEEANANDASSAQADPERFTGTLSPGETLTTIDGISITAREGALYGPKEIYMERVDPSELPIPLSEGLSAVVEGAYAPDR